MEKIILLGFSFGGELALEYALAQPQQVEKLILQAPSTGKSEQQACVQLNGFRSVVQGEMASKIREIADGPGSIEERLDQVWEVVDGKTVDRFLFHDQEAARMNSRMWEESGLVNTGQMHRALAIQPTSTPLLDRIQAVQVPTLVIAGLYDRNIGVELCRDVAALIPQAILALFGNSAHFSDMEEPEKYAQVVQGFLLE